MLELAIIVSSAALVVLVVVAGSGIGPALSLKRTIQRFGEVAEDVQALQRNLERLAVRTQEILEEPLRPPDADRLG